MNNWSMELIKFFFQFWLGVNLIVLLRSFWLIVAICCKTENAAHPQLLSLQNVLIPHFAQIAAQVFDGNGFKTFCPMVFMVVPFLFMIILMFSNIILYLIIFYSRVSRVLIILSFPNCCCYKIF